MDSAGSWLEAPFSPASLQHELSQMLELIQGAEVVLFISVSTTYYLDPRFLWLVDHELKADQPNNAVDMASKDVMQRFTPSGPIPHPTLLVSGNM